LTAADDDLAALEAFVVENAELRELERHIAPFNVFEALGIVRQELRHSDFLAFLLDPRQNHALGDVALKRFLQRATRGRYGLEVSAIELDVWDLKLADVRREWQSIDIAIVDHTNQLAVVIENKVDSDEHSDQCARYWSLMSDQYPSFRMLGILLTPNGVQASDDRYVSLSYGDVAEVVDELLAAEASALGADVRSLLVHYVQMLRRHIVEDSRVAELCRQIYRRHKQALDLIYEYRPDRQAEIRELLEQVVDECPDLVRDHCSKSYVRFAPIDWDGTSLGSASARWTPSGRMLLFEFKNDQSGVTLYLQLGPAKDPEADALRSRFYEAVSRTPPLKPQSALMKQWNVMWRRPVLTRTDILDEELDLGKLHRSWDAFLRNELPAIRDLVLREEWLVSGTFNSRFDDPS
jgi:hypothetical protein